MVCCGAGGQVHVVVLCRRIRYCHWRGDQYSGACNVGLAGGAGEQSVVADAMEPLRQNVEQEAPDELARSGHHRWKRPPPGAAVILVAEGHAALVEAD